MAVISCADVVFVVTRLGAALLALVLPRSLDRAFVRSFARAALSVRPGFERSVAARIERRSGGHWAGRRAARWARVWALRRAETRWAEIRALQPDGWKPSIEVVGLERLQAAHAARRGVVLWFSTCCESLVLFMGLDRAGVPLTHLSRSAHGAPSDSRFGLRVLTQVRRRVEGRYLKERIVIKRLLNRRARERLETVLRTGGVVTIRGDLTAQRCIPSVLFGQPIGLAPGAPYLAWRSGADLCPVHLSQSGFNRYRVVVGPPLEIDRNLSRKQFGDRAAAEYASSLEAWTRKHPADWVIWNSDDGFWGGRC